MPVCPIWQRSRRWNVYFGRPRLRSRGCLSIGYCPISTQSFECKCRFSVSNDGCDSHRLACAGTWNGDTPASLGRREKTTGGTGETAAGGDEQETKTSGDWDEAQGETKISGIYKRSRHINTWAKRSFARLLSSLSRSRGCWAATSQWGKMTLISAATSRQLDTTQTPASIWPSLIKPVGASSSRWAAR